MSTAANGFDQILWLFGAEQKVTEVGTMNFFVFWKNDKGEKELITPPLDGTILPGVTRQTILDLSRKVPVRGVGCPSSLDWTPSLASYLLSCWNVARSFPTMTSLLWPSLVRTEVGRVQSLRARFQHARARAGCP